MVKVESATLDDPLEMFIEKFRPDPFDPTVSYIDTTLVGNLAGFNGTFTLYRPNGFDYETHFACNMGGALADTSWLQAGDVPMVSFHTVFDPYAPFTEGIVIVPTTGEQVDSESSQHLAQRLGTVGMRRATGAHDANDGTASRHLCALLPGRLLS